MQSTCTKSLFRHMHIKGMYSWDCGKLLVKSNRTQLFLGGFCPYAQMDLHFSERVIPYVCFISIPALLADSLLKNTAFQSDVSRQLRTSSPWLWTASVAGRNDYLNKKLLMFSSIANIVDKDIPSVNCHIHLFGYGNSAHLHGLVYYKLH